MVFFGAWAAVDEEELEDLEESDDVGADPWIFFAILEVDPPLQLHR